MPDFAELLGRCRRSAVHLELRDSYDQLITDTVARGVAVRRARVVSEPVSAYIRWEHYVTHANVTAGEEVRWLPRRRATGIPLPGNDFWLFDGALLRVHHFSGDGAVVEDEITADPQTVALCATAFEAVWERAVPHHLYDV